MYYIIVVDNNTIKQDVNRQGLLLKVYMFGWMKHFDRNTIV